VQFCRDQHGSRFIQQKLEVASDAEKSAFFEEVSAITCISFSLLSLQISIHTVVIILRNAAIRCSIREH
jgi:Pumilio-family RNA binding repeat